MRSAAGLLWGLVGHRGLGSWRIAPERRPGHRGRSRGPLDPETKERRPRPPFYNRICRRPNCQMRRLHSSGTACPAGVFAGRTT